MVGRLVPTPGLPNAGGQGHRGKTPRGERPGSHVNSNLAPSPRRCRAVASNASGESAAQSAEIDPPAPNRQGQGLACLVLFQKFAPPPHGRPAQAGFRGEGKQALRPPRGLVLLQLALKRLDFLSQRLVAAHQMLDLADRVQHGGMVAAAKSPPNFR